MSNFDRVSMPNVMERRFALAATKSRVSSSSLSNVSMEGAAVSASCACFFCSRELNRLRLYHVSLIVDAVAAPAPTYRRRLQSSLLVSILSGLAEPLMCWFPRLLSIVRRIPEL